MEVGACVGRGSNIAEEVLMELDKKEDLMDHVVS